MNIRLLVIDKDAETNSEILRRYFRMCSENTATVEPYKTQSSGLDALKNPKHDMLEVALIGIVGNSFSLYNKVPKWADFSPAEIFRIAREHNPDSILFAYSTIFSEAEALSWGADGYMDKGEYLRFDNDLFYLDQKIMDLAKERNLTQPRSD